MSGPRVPLLRHGRDATAATTGARPGRARIRQMAGGVLADDASKGLPVRRLPDGAEYDGTIVAGPHLLLADVTVRGSLDIYARLPVVLRDVVIEAGPGHWGLYVRPEGGPVLVLDATVSGPAVGGNGAGMLVRRSGTVIRRTAIGGFSDGMRIGADRTVVSECLISALDHRDGDHNDGIQIEGDPSDVAIRRCRIINRHPQTSCIMIRGRRVNVEDCYLAGGGWTVYGGARHGASSITVAGTEFGRDAFAGIGRFGAVADWSRDPARLFQWLDNRRDDGVSVRP